MMRRLAIGKQVSWRSGSGTPGGKSMEAGKTCQRRHGGRQAIKSEKPTCGPQGTPLETAPSSMRKNIAKAKTRKGVAKRFKITGTGKLLRRKQGRRHLAECKSRKRKRNLRKATTAAAVDVPRLMACMPFA